MKNMPEEEKNQRVVTFLNREEVDFLDKLGKDALFSTGAKISRSKLIAWLVDFIESLRINGEDIKSERDFENRIRGVLQRGQFPPATPACRSGREDEFVPPSGGGTKPQDTGGER
jgi:hypothetical protein